MAKNLYQIASEYVKIIETIETVHDTKKLQDLEEQRVKLHWQFIELLEQQAHTQPNVEFVPGCSHENVIEYIKKAKALLITSEGEGWPNVLIEAAIFGRPIVSLNEVAGGVIQKQNIGYVTDNVEKMIHIIADLPENNWQNLGQNATDFIKTKFDNGRLTDQLISFLTHYA